MWRLHPLVLSGALWATYAVRVTKRRIRRHGIEARAPHPWIWAPAFGLGARGALSRLEPNCLEKALVLQTWALSQGRALDVIIGVPVGGIAPGAPAHAWIDGSDPEGEYLELHRLTVSPTK